MLDNKNVSTWLSGQLKTESGDIIKFEFVMDGDNGGGVVKLLPGGGAIDQQVLNTASGIFGPKMRELLVGGTNLFTDAEKLSKIPPIV